MTVLEPAYAKLNLSLDVLGKREDGYHDMEMVFQLISLHDDISVSVTDKAGVSLVCDTKYLPCDRSNIAYRCAEKFFEEINENRKGCFIRLTKRIPVCAGMGGGSADGAAVLRGLNRAFGNPVSLDRLMDISLDIGADIPFCLAGGTAIGRGKGELLQFLPDLKNAAFIVVKPSFSVSTPELFRKLDSACVTLHPDTKGLTEALCDHDIRKAGRRLFNVFEEVLPYGRRTINEIKGLLLDCDAAGAAMTGTGSAVFGLFEDKALAECALPIIQKSFPNSWAAEPIGRLIT